MKIEDKKFVAIDYVLTVDGEMVDKSHEDRPLGFVMGANQIIPGLEKRIMGMEKGDSANISVPSDEGYGEIRQELIQELPRENFPDDVEIEPGMVFQAQTPHGMMSFRISEVAEETVKADLNHPLAGKDLSFEVKIAEVRDATEDDLKPHSCDGSHDLLDLLRRLEFAPTTRPPPSLNPLNPTVRLGRTRLRRSSSGRGAGSRSSSGKGGRQRYLSRPSTLLHWRSPSQFIKESQALQGSPSDAWARFRGSMYLHASSPFPAEKFIS